MVSGDTLGIYNEPPISLLRISDSKKFAISFEGIPILTIGATSIPLNINLEAAPTSDLTLNFTASPLLTIAPVTFAAGDILKTFTLAISANATVGVYPISVESLGDNAASFYLSSTTLYVTVSNFDETAPGISSMVINNPKLQHKISMTFQATEACKFYYTYGERGLTPPSNTSIISMAETSTAGYYLGYIGASFIYNLKFENLRAEYDYILYGLLIDLNSNVMASVFSIDFYTAEYHDSIQITLKFKGDVNVTLLATTVAQVLADQMVHELEYIVYIPEESTRRLQDTSSEANYYIYTDTESTMPSPTDLVTYLAIPRELAERLLEYDIVLDQTHNIAQSIVTLPNPRPTWVSSPLVSSTTKTSVSINFSVSTNGTIYLEIINDGDTIPSSRQVSLGLNAYGVVSTMVYTSSINANEAMTITFSNLLPESSYIVIITAKNNDLRLPRLMSDDVMSKFQIITQAGSLNDDTETSKAELLAVVGLLLTLS